MKRLLFILGNINIGGPQKSLLALLDKLDYSRFQADVLVMQPGGELQQYYNPHVRFLDTPEVVTAATIPGKRSLYWLMVLLRHRKFRLFIAAFLAMIRHLLFHINMNQARQRIWRKHGQDLPKLPGSYDIAFCIPGLPTYYVADCVQADKKYNQIISDTRILQRDEAIDALYYRKMDGFLSVSTECADIFADIYPFTKGHIQVLYNYIPVGFYERMECDLSIIKDRKARYKIMTICRLDPLKGIEMAIEACRILLDRGYDICWFVLGNGSFRTEIESMLKEKQIEDRFILTGFQLNTLKFLQEADLYVHPSRTEGKSNAVDEAKYAGKPIVLTNYSTAGEVISDHMNGIICDMSGEAIADAVQEMIQNPELAACFGDRCRGHEDGIPNLNDFFEAL